MNKDSVAQLVERSTPDRKVACSSHVGVSYTSFCILSCRLNKPLKKKNQFYGTLDALKTYVSQKYIKHIDYLMPLFVDLSSPSIPMPTPPALKVKEEVELKDGTTLEIP